MAEENLAQPSNMEVAKDRSCRGNQLPTALALAGKTGASPTPRTRRAAKKPGMEGVAAAPKEARLQMRVLMRPTGLTPKRSRRTPTGSWQRA
jgi:hypothetical protein